jgi:hypothetical protein
MTTIRRITVLAGTFLAITIGSSLPASATYADSIAVTTSPMSISTGTVAAPEDTSRSQVIDLYNVTAHSVRCSVTTQTDYGWTAESTPTGWFRC